MIITWHEQNVSDVPSDNEWLSSPELARLADMRFAKRRDDWRLGRWTAKAGVARSLGMPVTRETFQRWEVRPEPSGAPEILFANQPAAVTISLSHRAGIAVCAVAPRAHLALALGCDIERVEPHSDLFLADYFTDQERMLVGDASYCDRCRLIALLWSAKESLLKALRIGLRLDTRSVNVSLEPRPFADTARWQTLHVYHRDCGSIPGWWFESAGFVRTLIASPHFA